MNIIENAQDIIIAKIEELIAATTIDSNFSVQDNNIDQGTLPVVIVDIVNSNSDNYSSGDTAFIGFKLELSVIAARSDNDDNFRTTQLFVIDTITTILNNLQANAGILYHKNIIWGEYKCALAYCEIEYLG